MNVETFQKIRREWRVLQAYEQGLENGRLEVMALVLDAAEAELREGRAGGSQIERGASINSACN